MNEIYEAPQIVFFSDLRLEGGHTGASAVADTAEDFAVGGAVAKGFWIGKVGGIGNHIDLGFDVVAVAADAVSQEGVAALGDGFFGEGDGILELFGCFGAEFAVLTGKS